MAVFVVVIFAPTSTQSSKSYFKEFTNQDGVVIKDGYKVRISSLHLCYLGGMLLYGVKASLMCVLYWSFDLVV